MCTSSQRRADVADVEPRSVQRSAHGQAGSNAMHCSAEQICVVHQQHAQLSAAAPETAVQHHSTMCDSHVLLCAAGDKTTATNVVWSQQGCSCSRAECRACPRARLPAYTQATGIPHSSQRPARSSPGAATTQANWAWGGGPVVSHGQPMCRRLKATMQSAQCRSATTMQSTSTAKAVCGQVAATHMASWGWARHCQADMRRTRMGSGQQQAALRPWWS